MAKRILIIGSLNMDMVIDMKAMPRVGETVLGSTLTYVPGGKGANQTYAAGKIGGNVAMLGCVGDDTVGETLIQNLATSGADASAIRRVKGEPTGTAVIYVNEDGDNSIVVVSGANAVCDIAYLKEYDDFIANADYVMLQMEIPYETVFYAIRRAKELGKTVILNPAPAPLAEQIPTDIWDKIDYFTPNETELLKLTNQDVLSEENVKKGAETLIQKGVKHVLVTLGDKGVFYFDGESGEIFPARKVDAVDTTAAGDCFSGAFVTGLSEGKTVADAISMANLASSLAVTRKGAQSSIPTRQEINVLMNSETME